MLTLDQVQRKLWQAIWMSRGRPPQPDDTNYYIKDNSPDFWNALDKHGTDEMRPPVIDYALKRASGWQSGGADVPPYGEYADPPTPWHAVPAYPGDTTPEPQPEPPQPPSSLSNDPLGMLLGVLLDRLDHLEQAIAVAADRPAPVYTATLKLPAWLGGPQTLTLTPQTRGGDGVPR